VSEENLMDKFMKDNFIEDMASVNRVEGITEDYVWYQSQILTNKMKEWQLEFDKVVGVMEARHKEHLKIIGDLLDEIKKLKEKANESIPKQ
jgi:predicted 2-oxoglutarate/Fe(II)-dependent dioxygenase YbiX